MQSLNWNVPRPGATEIEGMPVYWRYQWGVDESGIHAEAVQLVAVRQTEHYAWLAPAHWFDDNARRMYGITNFSEYAARVYSDWQNKRNRYAVKKVRRDAHRSYAYVNKSSAFTALVERQRYRIKCLRRDLAVCETLVSGLNGTNKDGIVIPPDRLDFGHNQETESWVFM